ncbi:MAG: tetratricopeptide repeat protein [Pseudomonadota bacterium]
MSDDSFFREVDEELRSERMKNFWSAWGKFIIAAAVLIVAGIAAWRAYEFYTVSQAQAVGDRYMEAVELAEAGSSEEARSKLEALEADAPPAYRALAKMRRAAELAPTDKAAASALYDEISADSAINADLRDIATIRGAMVQVDIGSVADVESRVQRLTAPSAPYRGSAREALGLAHYKAGALDEAFTQFKTIADDDQLPSAMRQRAGIMLDVIASRGGPVYEAPATL